MNLRQLFCLIKSKAWPSEHDKRVRAFHQANTDGAIIFRHELGPASVVLDVGGFRGDFAAEIMARYRSEIYVFEPIAAHNRILSKRFSRNPSIHLFGHALGESDREITFNVAAEGSSSCRKGNSASEVCRIRNIGEWWHAIGAPRINLMKINIEGGEYELLPAMRACGMLAKIDTLLIQFHCFNSGDDVHRCKIREFLAEDFIEEYCQPFVWERWVKRPVLESTRNSD